MARSIFSRILDGDLPATFVWNDERVGAFLSIEPLAPGHVLVVPRREVTHWIDLEPDELSHLMSVARSIGTALDRAYGATKVGAMFAGLEVEHVHLHLVPIRDARDLEFGSRRTNVAREELEREGETIKAALAALGLGEVPGTGGGAST